jgi:hypothetical protein
MHVPCGAFFINKEFEFISVKMFRWEKILGLSNRCFEVILKILREKRCFRG